MRTWGRWQQMQHTTLRYSVRNSPTNSGALCFHSVQDATWVQQGTLGKCRLQNERSLSSHRVRTGSRLHSEIILPVSFRVPCTNSHRPTTIFNDMGGNAMLPKSWSFGPRIQRMEREGRIHPQLHPVHGHAPWLASHTDPTND